MAPITGRQRAQLRSRLLKLLTESKSTPPEALESQLDQLLREVLTEQQAATTIAPWPARIEEEEKSDDQRVVITGIGPVTPLGIGIEPYWSGLVAGRSAISRFTLCDPTDYPSQIGAEVKDFNPKDYLDGKDARRMSRASQFAVAAARLAIADAELDIERLDPYEIGVLIGSGTTSLPDTEKAVRTMSEKGTMKVSPLFIPMALPNMASCQVAIQLGVRGYNTTISTACAASSQAIGEAAQVIRRGDANIMLAGGTEAPVSRLALEGFCAMRALSTSYNDQPERASRPFDLKRDGFIGGEGAAILVLERLSHARRRGATIYAELIGYGASCDAYHITAPDPEGAGAAAAMWRALASANLSPQQIDYINAHATSTPTGDIAETRAIKRVFGEYAYSIPISSTKSMIGHLTGAAGAVEAVATILCLVRGVLHPTINQEFPDPECDLDYVPNVARAAPDIQTVMSNSFGFGGVNSVLIFSKLPK